MAERAGEQAEGYGKVLKRRGILAAAGVAVAAVVAKQAAEFTVAGDIARGQAAGRYAVAVGPGVCDNSRQGHAT